MSKTKGRLKSNSVSFHIGIDGRADHLITVNLGYGPVTMELVEVAFCEAGKIGHGLQILLADLGIKLSRAIQSRHPDTGEPIEDPTVKEDGAP